MVKNTTTGQVLYTFAQYEMEAAHLAQLSNKGKQPVYVLVDDENESIIISTQPISISQHELDVICEGVSSPPGYIIEQDDIDWYSDY